MRSLKFPIYVRPFGPFVLVDSKKEYQCELELRKKSFPISLLHIKTNSNTLCLNIGIPDCNCTSIMEFTMPVNELVDQSRCSEVCETLDTRNRYKVFGYIAIRLSTKLIKCSSIPILVLHVNINSTITTHQESRIGISTQVCAPTRRTSLALCTGEKEKVG